MRYPKLCLHKASGRGYSTDPHTGKPVYHGKFGTAECLKSYDQWLREFVARREGGILSPPGAKLTINGFLADYIHWARGYYRKHGKPTSEVYNMKAIAAAVSGLYGECRVDQFGPAQLKAVREAMVRAGLVRRFINSQMGRLRRIWRWGVEHELVPSASLAGLDAVAPLSRGRTAAREGEPVQPVPLEVVGACIFHADGQLGSMIRLHLFGCMRAEDVVMMRGQDIDQHESPWCYTPWTHKTEHLDRQRRIYLGPVAQAVLEPILRPGWLFHSRPRGLASKYDSHLTVQGYRLKIHRLCARFGIPDWFPLQLRHTALTMVRRRYGLEGAQIAGGHSHADVTQLYTERDELFARKIASELG